MHFYNSAGLSDSSKLSNFIDFAFENSIYKVGNQFTYNTSPGNVTITLNDLNAKVLEGLSSWENDTW